MFNHLPPLPRDAVQQMELKYKGLDLGVVYWAPILMFPLESCVSHQNNCCKTDVLLYISNNAKNAFYISFWLKLWYHLMFFFPVKLVFQLRKGHKSTLIACTLWSCIAHSKLWGDYCTVWSPSWWKWPCTHISHAETPLVPKEEKQWQDVPPFFWWLQMALVFFAAICIQR